MTKTTIQDLAAIAGLSTSTVDRVVNGRSGVSEKAREKVKAAIHESGFGLLGGDLLVPSAPVLNLHFLLCELPTSFSNRLVNSFVKAAEATKAVKINYTMRRVGLRHGRKLIEEINRIDSEKCDGVALFAIDAPGVRPALNRLIDKGVNVVTVVSDLPSSRRQHFVGIDNTAAGRVAGNLMGRFIGRNTRGKVGVLVGALRQRDLADRYFGCEQVIRTNFPNLKVLPIEEGESVSSENRDIINRLIKKHRDLLGIYSCAAGNKGILEALKENNAEKNTVFIAHELSSSIKDGLISGAVDAVLAQDTGRIARSTLRFLRSLHYQTPIDLTQEKIGFDIYFADNLP